MQYKTPGMMAMTLLDLLYFITTRPFAIESSFIVT